jgi:penicillin-binding protein 1A
MASSYGVFDNKGKRAAPTPVVLIKGPAGETVEDNTGAAAKAAQVIPQVVADNVTDVLRGVITKGTAYPNADIGRPAAGKTGTAQEYRDAWFVGYTPTLSTAIWLGDQDKPTPMHNIKGVRNVAGGTIPASVWHDFMAKALKDVPVTDFNQPAPITPLADELKRKARSGFDPGNRRPLEPINDGGPYEISPPPPRADAPTSTTSTTSPDETTTTTGNTIPFP